MKHKRKGKTIVMLLLMFAFIGTEQAEGTSKESGKLNEEAQDRERPETITYESPVFLGDGEEYKPKEWMEQGGKTYRLVSTNIRRAQKEGELTFLTSESSFELEGTEEPPESAVITVKETGSEYERQVPLLETEELQVYWMDDFRFSVTVSGYGADTLKLGEYEIPGDAELSDYGKELLESMGLPEEAYRVERVSWIGEPYEKEGVMFRDAEASGSRRIRRVTARYGGQVRTPDLDGKQYIGIYEAIEETVETIPETERTEQTERGTDGTKESRQEELPAPSAQLGVLDRLINWLTRRRTVVAVSMMFFLILAAGGWLFVRSFYRKEED